MKSAAKSNGSPEGTDAPGIVARGTAAYDMLGVGRGRDAIVVACSGGADSAAALLVTRRARPQARLFACYVDHGVRPASSIARDRRAVRAQARAAKATTAFVRLPASKPKSAPTEAALRAGRYRALAQFARSVDAQVVVTGHQRDDVAESTLMALVRGSGIDGIAAMRPRRPIGRDVDIVRPLLWASRAMLARYVEDAGLDVSVDETNDDVRYRRNAIRRLLGTLETAARGSIRAIARSAAIAVEDKALLDAVTTAAWSRCTAPDGRGLVAAELRKLPSSLVRRVLRFEVKGAAGSGRDFSYEHCVAIERALKERRGGTFHAGASRIELSGGRVRVLHPPSRDTVAADDVEVAVPAGVSRIAWGGGRIELRTRSSKKKRDLRTRAQRGRLELDGKALAPGTALLLRRPGKGDRFVPAGKHADVSVARFLAKAGLSKDERANVPLLCLNDTIVAVLGVRSAASFAARPGSPVLGIAWTPPAAPKRRREADD